MIGHRSKSKHTWHMTDHAVLQSDKVAGEKRPAARSSECPLFPIVLVLRSGGDVALAKTKHQVSAKGRYPLHTAELALCNKCMCLSD